MHAVQRAAGSVLFRISVGILIMASSNKHWPSLFKSKHCAAHHQQSHPWHHGTNNPQTLFPCSCQRPVVPGGEERTSEPKMRPRWNPRQEQIRILEAVFESGMVNPPREEIRRIRAQLQEYGPVGDSNVFYWFQNRKSRTKHRLRRHLSFTRQQQQRQQQNRLNPDTISAYSIAASSSTSSSELSTSSVGDVIDFPAKVAVPGELFFQINPSGYQLQSTEVYGMVGDLGAQGLGLLHSHRVDGTSATANAVATATATTSAVIASSTTTVASPVVDVQGVCDVGGGGVLSRSVVFINDVAFEVGEQQQLNVRGAFGEGVVLLHSSGQPVLLDHRGFSLQPLQHGASYYLV